MIGQYSQSSDAIAENLSFRDVVEVAEVFTLPDTDGDALVEIVGHIQKTQDERKFLMRVSTQNERKTLAFELDVDDVKKFIKVFEDSAGRCTYKVSIAQDSIIKLIYRASTLATNILPETEGARKPAPIAPWRYDLGRQFAPDHATQNDHVPQVQSTHTQYAFPYSGQDPTPYTGGQAALYQTEQYDQNRLAEYPPFSSGLYAQPTYGQLVQNAPFQITQPISTQDAAPYTSGQRGQYPPAQYDQYTSREYTHLTSGHDQQSTHGQPAAYAFNQYNQQISIQDSLPYSSRQPIQYQPAQYEQNIHGGYIPSTIEPYALPAQGQQTQHAATHYRGDSSGQNLNYLVNQYDSPQYQAATFSPSYQQTP